MINNKKAKDDNKKKVLISNAKLELQKTQQFVLTNEIKIHLLNRHNNKLRTKIVLRDEILSKNGVPSTKLSGEIENNQDVIEDMLVEIDQDKIEIYASNDKARQAISELRKTDKRAADLLENSLSIKKESKKSHIIIKKRM